MKKKTFATAKDKKDWVNFIQEIGKLHDKDKDDSQLNNRLNKVQKLDLHGFSLVKANKEVEKFINESFEIGYKKLLIITGKGSRKKVHENPYLSEKMNVLKHSVPDFINNSDLLNKIKTISKADKKHGGDGAFYIFLKKN